MGDLNVSSIILLLYTLYFIYLYYFLYLLYYITSQYVHVIHSWRFIVIMNVHLEVCIGGGEEELALDQVDLVGAALLGREPHGSQSALWCGEVAADDERVRAQVVVEAEHHRVTRLHHHLCRRQQSRTKQDFSSDAKPKSICHQFTKNVFAIMFPINQAAEGHRTVLYSTVHLMHKKIHVAHN